MAGLTRELRPLLPLLINLTLGLVFLSALLSSIVVVMHLGEWPADVPRPSDKALRRRRKIVLTLMTAQGGVSALSLMYVFVPFPGYLFGRDVLLWLLLVYAITLPAAHIWLQTLHRKILT